MKTPEQAAADWLAKYEAGGPEGAVGRLLDEYEREARPAAIRTAWAAYNDPETPEELRKVLHAALDNMIKSL